MIIQMKQAYLTLSSHLYAVIFMSNVEGNLSLYVTCDATFGGSLTFNVCSPESCNKTNEIAL